MCPILLDCDTGIDDAVALTYLACLHRQGTINLAAVTTTAGNTTAAQAAMNSRFVLDQCLLVDVPVAAGCTEPLQVPLVTTPETHGPLGVGYAEHSVDLPPAQPEEWMRLWDEAIQEHEDLHLIVTGPATNLATYMQQRDQLPKHVTLMGGAYLYPGNTTPTAEWNSWVDPHAAQVAFKNTPTPITVCSLEVTEQMVITPDDLPLLPEFLHPMLRFYFEFHQAQGEGYQAQIHDLLTCMVALDTVPYQAIPVTVDVETTSQLLRGTTVADFKNHWGRPHNARLVRDADVKAAKRELVGVVKQLL